MDATDTAPLVLLVTDIPDQALSYVDALQRGGCRVQLATTGRDALAIVRPLKPDCAVIDLRLPDITGWELCRRLRAHEGCDEIRLVVLVPEVTRATADAGREVGCHAWLAHPSVAEDLIRTIRHVLAFAEVEPAAGEEALVVTTCLACGSDRVRATLRVSPIQYYCCGDCSFCWRVDVVTSAPL